MADLNITVQNSNNLNVEVVPTPTQTIQINRGVSGVGIESVSIVYEDPYYYLDFQYTNGTNELVQLPAIAAGVVSFNTRVGVVTLESTDVTDALGYTPPEPDGTGATGTWNISVTGNAATVTNGVYTTGTYSNPLWITALAGSKITGDISGNAENVNGTVGITHGGTGQVTANAAFNALAPSQTSQSGKYLRTDGTNTDWDLIDISTADITGVLPVEHGGTGASTAAGARANLGAAINGANNDITSMTALTGGISTPDYITFDTTPETVPVTEGSLYWDSADGNQTLSLVMAGGTAIQQIGEEQYYRIKASSAITEGQVVMFTGTVGASGALTGAPAFGLTASTASYVMGIATQNIAINGWGYVTSFGLVRSINTTAFTDGAILYLDPTVAGGLTATIPSAPNPKVQVCACIHAASNGSLFVRPSFGGILGQYEGDVNINGVANGDLLIRNQTAGKWVNAALTAGTGIGVTNGAGSVTISNSGVVSLTGTANEIDVSAATGSVTLSLPATINANTTGNAATASKWATARTLSFTGDATGSGSVDGSDNVATALTLANSGVTASTYKSVTVNAKGLVTAGTNPTTLAGYGITDAINSSEKGTANGVATLDGSGKVPLSEIPASLIGNVSYQGTWDAATNTPTLTSSVGTKGFYYVVNVAGSTNLNGITSWNVGDWAIFDGSVWGKVDNTDSVTSVNGYTGAVVLSYSDVGAPSTSGTNATGTWGISISGNAGTVTNGVYTTDTGTVTNTMLAGSIANNKLANSTISGVSLGSNLNALTIGSGLGGTSYNGSAAVTITNTAPDQTVVLTSGTGISATGTYPNFTITNTAPDQVVTLTGGGTTTISGTYPNFTISSSDAYVGTVTSVSGTGTVSGITLTGTVTTSGSLTLGGTLDLSSPPAIGSSTPNTGAFTTLSATGAVTFSGGTANGVAYLNGSKVLTTGSALTFDGTNFTTPRVVFGGSTLPAAGTPSIALRSSDNTIYHQSGSANAIVLLDSSQNTMQYVSSTSQIWNITGSEQMRLTSTGLGIGTSSPAAKLDVVGTIRANSNQVAISNSTSTYGFSSVGVLGAAVGNPGLGGQFVCDSAGRCVAFSTTDDNNNNAGSQLRVNFSASTGNNATISLVAYGNGSASGYTDLSFQALTQRFETNGSERMRIDSSGNVGIGTSSPSVKLEVAGNAKLTGTFPTLTIASSDNLSIIAMSNSGGATKTGSILTDNGGSMYFRDTAFYWETYDGVTRRATLDSSGNLGLGVTPSAWSTAGKIIQFGNGNASIGTQNSGDANFMHNAYESPGSTFKYIANGPALRYQLDINNSVHKWYYAGSGTAGNAISFTQAMTLDASGNLGVGNSTVTALGTGVRTLLLDGSAGSGLRLYVNSAATAYLYTDSAQTILATQTATPLYFSTSGNERMRIDSSGNVGIGSSSTYNQKVQIVGASANDTNGGGTGAATLLGLTDTTSYAAGVGGGVGFDGYYDGTPNRATFGVVRGIKENATSGNYASAMTFFTRADGGSLTERMRLDSSGNLGLGVTPSAWGASGLKAFSVGPTVSLVSDTSANALLTYNSYLNSSFQYIYQNNGYASYYFQGSGQHKWYTAPSGTAGTAITFNQAMTLDASGNLGVGTASPSNVLHVNAAAGSSIVRLSDTTNGTYGFIGQASGILSGSNTALGIRSQNEMIFGTAGNNERMRIDASGNVGIGTSSPSAKVHAYSGASGNTLPTNAQGIFESSVNGGIALSAPAANATGVYFPYSTDAYAYGLERSTNTLSFRAGGSVKALLDSSGNLGLGVTPSAWANTKAFQVGGFGAVSCDTASDGNVSLSWNAYATGTSSWFYKAGGTSLRYTQDGAHKWFTAPSGTAGNAISFTQAMTLDASGRLLVGQTSPAYGSAGYGEVEINGSTGSLLGLNVAGAAGAYLQANGNLNIYNANSGFTAFGTSNTERMRIDSSGNVGIGTSSPTQKLSVAAAAALMDITSTTGTNFNGLEMKNTGGSLYFGIDSSTGGFYATSAYAGVIYRSGAYPLAFSTNGTERMRIDSSGRLYVNQTTGNGNTLQRMGITYDGSVEWGLSFRNSWSGDGGSAINFNNYAGTQVGTIQAGATSTSYNTSSDYRLKENIQPMQNALGVVAQLNPVTYTWKADGSDGQGFIAHELQAVVPDCVTGEKDAVDEEGNPKYQGIDTSFLVATLTKAIQELKAELDATKAEVAALKGA